MTLGFFRIGIVGIPFAFVIVSEGARGAAAPAVDSPARLR